MKKASLFLCFFVISVLVYYWGLHIPYYADDYQRVFQYPSKFIFDGFIHSNPSDQFYRPLETMVLAIVQTFWGWDTLVFRFVSILFHAAGAYLVFHALRTWKVDALSALLGALVMIVSQAAAAAVLGNDTQSQVTSSFFCALTLWLVYRYIGDRSRRNLFITSIITAILAYFSKETSVCLPLGIIVLLFAMEKNGGSLIQRLWRSILGSMPYIITGVLYISLRVATGSIFQSYADTKYSLGIGKNVLANAAMLVLQSVLPVSSMTVLRVLHYHDLDAIISIAIFTMVYTIVLFYGLWKSQMRSIIIMLIALALSSWFPIVFMKRVGELYAYNMLPFVAVLTGIAIAYYRTNRAKFVIALQISLPIIFVAGLVGNALGVKEKSVSMKRMGDRAEVFFPQIIRYAKSIPFGETMYFISPKDSSFEYSVIAIRGTKVSTCMEKLVQDYSGRQDIHFLAIDSALYAQSVKENPGPVFTYDTLSLRVYPFAQ